MTQAKSPAELAAALRADPHERVGGQYDTYSDAKVRLALAHLLDEVTRKPDLGDERQAIAGQWACRCFGEQVTADRKERALRVLEEAIELAQAEGIEVNQAANLVGYVYSRPPGEPSQELGGDLREGDAGIESLLAVRASEVQS